ncbi:MAG: (2Fe-2S)-binding protein [Pseudomonadales bacterium]
MYVCLCKAVTDHEIAEAVDGGISDLESLEHHSGVGTGCGCCREFAQQIIDARLAERTSYAA